MQIKKKRGRPSKADILAREVRPDTRTEVQILQDLRERFDILALLTKGAVARNVRAVTVTGAPGVGKTYTVEQILEASKVRGTSYHIVRGAVSAVELYKLAYQFRKPGSVIVLDDADGIFNDEDALNILKALCDSSDTRTISWLKDSHTLAKDEVPTSFEFHGAMIFISNLNFQEIIDNGKGKHVLHFEALMSRSLYLDLRLHSRNELGVWIQHVATSGNIFRKEGISEAQGAMILKFLREHRHTLRELSLRTLLKTIQLSKSSTDWYRIAKVLLTKH